MPQQKDKELKTNEFLLILMWFSVLSQLKKMQNGDILPDGIDICI